jgi:hypothetical protein
MARFYNPSRRFVSSLCVAHLDLPDAAHGGPGRDGSGWRPRSPCGACPHDRRGYDPSTRHRHHRPLCRPAMPDGPLSPDDRGFRLARPYAFVKRPLANERCCGRVREALRLGTRARSMSKCAKAFTQSLDATSDAPWRCAECEDARRYARKQ